MDLVMISWDFVGNSWDFTGEGFGARGIHIPNKDGAQGRAIRSNKSAETNSLMLLNLLVSVNSKRINSCLGF